MFPSIGVFQIYFRDPKLLSTFKHFLPYWMLSSELLSTCVLLCYSLVLKLSWNKCNSHSFFLVSEDMSLTILSALFFLSCSMNFMTPLLQPLPMIRLAFLGLSMVVSVVNILICGYTSNSTDGSLLMYPTRNPFPTLRSGDFYYCSALSGFAFFYQHPHFWEFIFPSHNVSSQ